MKKVVPLGSYLPKSRYAIDHDGSETTRKPCCSKRKLGFGLVLMIAMAVLALVVWKIKENVTFECPEGYWCFRELFLYKCPAGRFGNVTGNVDPNCTGVCKAGFYCPEGSISAEQHICPRGYYCPEGSGVPLSCPGGTYASLEGMHTSDCEGNCTAGYYCPEKSTSSTEIICPVGYYCPERSPAPIDCPHGFYGDTTGLDVDTCTGPCIAKLGWYCPPRSTGNDHWEKCPPGYYCDGSVGNTSKQPCPGGTASNDTERGTVCVDTCVAGYYCPDASTSTTEAVCPPGHYCPAGSKEPLPCPSGTYANTTGLTTSACEGLCAGGSWCDVGSTRFDQAVCPEGFYCPEGATNYTDYPCIPGFACTFGTPFPTVPCARGHYCPERTRDPYEFPCPAGTWMGVEGASNCTDICPTGYYCPEGTSNPYNKLCKPGSYCPQGTKHEKEFLCPGGTFSARWALINETGCECHLDTDPSCLLNGPCVPRYYCPPGSSSARQTKCPANHYCPGNSSEPIPCNEQGYYCLEREDSPLARPNDASIFILNTLSQKADLWASDNPAVAERYMFQGMSKVEAFKFDVSKTTYQGSLYTDVVFSGERGVDVVEVTFTVRGFYNASIHICNHHGEILYHIGDVSMALRDFSSTQPLEQSFSFAWMIPRDALLGNLSFCTLYPKANDPNYFHQTETFHVVRPQQVAPIRQIALICLTVLLVFVILIGPAVYFVVRSDRSRAWEVIEWVKPAPPRLAFLLFMTHVIVELPQYLCIIFWHPLARNGSGNDLPHFVTHLIALHPLPLLGYPFTMVGIVLPLLFGALVCWKLGKKRKRALVLSVIHEVLYIPILLTILDPLYCKYTDSENGDQFYEFEDQIFMQHLSTFRCWAQNPVHVLLAIVSAFAGAAFYVYNLKFAFRNEGEEFAYVRYIDGFRVYSIVLKTTLCFWSLLPVPVPGMIEPGLYFGIGLAILCGYSRLYSRYSPALGRSWKTNNGKVVIYSVSAWACVWGFVSAAVNDGKSTEDRSLWPFFVFAGTSFLVAHVANFTNTYRSREHVRNVEFKDLSLHHNRNVRETCLRGSLDFLTVSANKQGFLAHLGELTQEMASEYRAVNIDAVCKILKSNSEDSCKQFCVSTKYLKYLGKQDRDRKDVIVLGGDPKEMLCHMFSSMSTIDLTNCGLKDCDAIQLAKVIPSLPDLHTLKLCANPQIGPHGIDVLLDSFMEASTLQHFFFTRQDDNDALGNGKMFQFIDKISRLLVQRIETWSSTGKSLPLTRFDLGQQLLVRVVLKDSHGKVNLMPFVSVEEEHAVMASNGVIHKIQVHVRQTTLQFPSQENRLYRLLASLQGLSDQLHKGFTIDLDFAFEDSISDVGKVLCEFKQRFPLGDLHIQDVVSLNQNDHMLDMSWLLDRIVARETLGIADTSTSEQNESVEDVLEEIIKMVIGLVLSHRSITGIGLKCTQRFLLSNKMATELASAVLENENIAEVVMNEAVIPIRQLKGITFQPNVEFIGDRGLRDQEMFFVAPILEQNKVVKKLNFHAEKGSSSTLTSVGLIELVQRIQGAVQSGQGIQCLKKLTFGNWEAGCDFSFPGIVKLAELFQNNFCPLLTSIDLQNCNIDSGSCRELCEALKTNTVVTSLKISGNSIGDVGAGAVGLLLCETRSIKKLHLARNQISGKGILVLCDNGLTANETLTKLVLDGNPIGKDVTVLKRLVGSIQHISELGLVDCELEDLDPLSRFIGKPEQSCNLKVLNIANNPQALTFALCNELKTNETLEDLQLCNCGLSDLHVAPICEIFTMKSKSALRALDLSRNDISDLGCQPLANSLSKSGLSLRCLCLAMNPQISIDGRNALMKRVDKSVILEL